MISVLEARQLANAAADKRAGAKEFQDRIDAEIRKVAESREGFTHSVTAATDGLAAEVVQRVAMLYRANEWVVAINTELSTIRLTVPVVIG